LIYASARGSYLSDYHGIGDFIAKVF
jgi:hypothetical protein